MVFFCNTIVIITVIIFLPIFPDVAVDGTHGKFYVIVSFNIYLDQRVPCKRDSFAIHDCTLFSFAILVLS